MSPTEGLILTFTAVCVLTDSVTSFLGLGREQPSTDDLVLEKVEFEPTVFEICADNAKVNMLYYLLHVLVVCSSKDLISWANCVNLILKTQSSIFRGSKVTGQLRDSRSRVSSVHKFRGLKVWS